MHVGSFARPVAEDVNSDLGANARGDRELT